MVKATVIGSFPHGPGEVAKVLALQQKYEVDIVCDGQLRYDMNTYFARIINGFELGLDKPHLTGKVCGVRSGELKELLGDLALANKYVASAHTGGYKPELKANLTGPVTLAFSSAFEAMEKYGYKSPFKLEKGVVVNKQLWLDLGDAMNAIVKEYERIGIRHIQIDEPWISAERKSTVPFLRLALGRIISDDLNYGTEFYLHVCGDIKGRFKELAALDGISGLSFEFAGTPSNLEVLSEEALAGSDCPKRLLLGVLDSKEPEPDSVLGVVSLSESDEEIREAIRPYVRNALRIYAQAAGRTAGERNIAQINPDCGLGGFRRYGEKGPLAAASKLRILQEIKNEINACGELFKEAMGEHSLRF
jgi:methionine synthase II (cobalamin-independent)